MNYDTIINFKFAFFNLLYRYFMIKVIPQSIHNIENKLNRMKIDDLIILELVFDENLFSMHSELTVTKLDKENQTGLARFNQVRETNKTFNDYSAYQGTIIPFSYADICDVNN